MNELVQMVQQKTGLSPEMAQQVVQVVLEHIKGKLPEPMAAGLENLLAGGGGSSGGSMLDEAKGLMGGLMGNKDA